MATAMKKEPKAGKKENKSAMIRQYAQAHQTATAKEIAETLGCSEGLVHSVRNKMKAKRKYTRKATGETVAATNGTAQASPAELCVTFIRAAGSFAEAKKMLMAAEVFAGFKIR
jgi:hypothetical protein